MGKQPKSSAQVRDGGASSPCAQCRIRPFNICKVLLDGKGASPRQPSSHPDWQAHNKIAPHKIIKTVGERLDRVHVVCAGWAFRYVQLANGRRQVLSILAPGDVITPSRPFDDVVSYSVQAVTEVRYCGYSRPLLKDRLVRDPHLFAAWAELMIAERKQNFSMLIELGSLSAEERLADFLIQLVARLSQRPSLVEDPILIPLPQWLIAAALGLTTEHVSRVIGAFRQRNMVESGRGFLRIVDLHELRRIVGMRT